MIEWTSSLSRSWACRDVESTLQGYSLKVSSHEVRCIERRQLVMSLTRGGVAARWDSPDSPPSLHVTVGLQKWPVTTDCTF